MSFFNRVFRTRRRPHVIRTNNIQTGRFCVVQPAVCVCCTTYNIYYDNSTFSDQVSYRIHFITADRYRPIWRPYITTTTITTSFWPSESCSALVLCRALPYRVNHTVMSHNWPAINRRTRYCQNTCTDAFIPVVVTITAVLFARLLKYYRVHGIIFFLTLIIVFEKYHFFFFLVVFYYRRKRLDTVRSWIFHLQSRDILTLVKHLIMFEFSSEIMRQTIIL